MINNSYLRKSALRDKKFAELDKFFHLKDSQAININGPGDAQKTALMIALTQSENKPPCLLVPDELRARAASSEIRAFTDSSVFIFRPKEYNLTDADAVSRESEMKRMAILDSVLSNKTEALIITAAASMQKLMPVEVFQKSSFKINQGMSIEIEDLCKHLQKIGYERTSLVEDAGQFARRGDIVDVALPSPEEGIEANALRISFFDLDIDCIKTFDMATQRSQEKVDQINIFPIREILIEDYQIEDLSKKIDATAAAVYRQSVELGAAKALAENSRSICRRDAERIAQSIYFAGLDRWISWIYPQSTTVFDYINAKHNSLFIDEPLRFRNRLDAAQADLNERIKHMMEKGQTVVVSGEPCLRGADVGIILSNWPGLTAFCQIASSGNGLPGAKSFDIQGRAADNFRGREKQLIEFIRQQPEDSLNIVFTGSETRKKRISEFFAENEISALISDNSLVQGFVWPAARISAIGTQDVFGSEKSSKKRRHSGIKIDLFSDLVTGEFVVHEAHGIGRYEGLHNMDNNGIRRDYLKIRYANDDVLYIPIESLDQIQKYVGAEGRDPRLSKLGGQDWNKLKDRAKQSIKKLATDLIKLYAQRQAVKGYRFSPDTVWQNEFEDDFPYVETEDQLKCIEEIKTDMESEKVMDRLLCGDVGFGKTEVAFRAIFKCVMDSKQAVMLSPTTVLAQQHYENLKRRMAQFPVKIGLLSRFASSAMQKQTIKGLNNGEIDIVVGTHRLLSKDVVYKDPGLLVVDEEQRFGVDHKEKIKDISPNIDVLTLTATPIPRTLHLSMTGIRDISVIEQAPQERRPVQTYVMDYDEDIITEACLREISRKGQVFYLFNDTRKIIEKTAALEKLLPGAQIVYAHGKMGEKKLEDIINSFINGEADILVCTTIIESGIDMPNVNTIIVENADRLGLSQLYQLRGRVGRSDRQAFAYITYRRDKILTEIAEKRLAAIRDFTELGAGFKIALRDLEVRGAGNLLGAEQHGHLDSIGYDLYCKMLEETIKEMQGFEKQKLQPTVIDLDVDAYLSSSFIPDEGQRMDMYRKIAGIDSLTVYHDVIDEIIDRYGDLPVAAMTLTDIAYIRGISQKRGLIRIYEQKPNIVMTYADQYKPDMAFVSALMSLPEAKGMLLFNAGIKPHIVFRQAGADRNNMISKLRRLLAAAEQVLSTLNDQAKSS